MTGPRDLPAQTAATPGVSQAQADRIAADARCATFPDGGIVPHDGALVNVHSDYAVSRAAADRVGIGARPFSGEIVTAAVDLDAALRMPRGPVVRRPGVLRPRARP